MLSKSLTSAALIVLTILVRWPPHGDLPRFHEALAVAQCLAQTGTFSNPFATTPTGPTAHVAPLFPAFAAIVVAVFGDGPRTYFVLSFAATTVMAVLVALLPVTTAYLRLGFAPGVFASFLYLVAKVPVFEAWETTYVALVTLLLTLLMYQSLSVRPTLNRTVLTGAVWGIAILLNPVLALPFLAWFAYSVFQAYPRHAAFVAMLSLGVPAMFCAPWILRNYAAFDRLIFVRDNLGLELQVSNNDCAHFSLRSNLHSGCFAAHHPNVNRSQAEQIKALGEIQYNKQKLRSALAWIWSHPHRFVDLSVQRFVHFWFPTEGLRLVDVHKDTGGYRQYALVVWAATLLSLVGLGLGWLHGHRHAVVLSLLWVFFYPPVYYLVQYENRYRVPILWVTFMWAGYAGAKLLVAARIRTPKAARSTSLLRP